MLLFPLQTWSDHIGLPLSEGIEIQVDTYPAQGDHLLLWFMCDEGHGPGESRLASELARRGIEVWIPDLIDAHFLPRLPSSLKSLPPDEVGEVIQQVAMRSPKHMTLVSAGHGAITLMQGIDAARKHATMTLRFNGIILLYPDLYQDPPSPGIAGIYHPAVTENSLPVHILQPQRSPGLWWLNSHKAALSKNGAPVVSQVLPGVRNHFFVRPDATEEESAMTARLPELIQEAIQHFPRSPAP